VEGSGLVPIVIETQYAVGTSEEYELLLKLIPLCNFSATVVLLVTICGNS